MNILQLNDFVSERMKVKPVTNAEWEKAQKEYKNLKNLPFTKDLSFTKDSITCGTIVMFSDGTLGVYMDGAISHTISVFFGKNRHGKAFYLTIPNATRIDSSTLLDSDNFTNDLKLHINKELYIIRIYNNAITLDEMKSLANDDFYSVIEKMAKDRTYIERQ